MTRCKCGQMLLHDEIERGTCYYCHNNIVAKDKKPRPEAPFKKKEAEE